MTKEGNTTFEEVFSVASSTDSIKLLSWCVSSAVPFCYISEVLATAMQQGKNVESTALQHLSQKGSPVSMIPQAVQLIQLVLLLL